MNDNGRPLSHIEISSNRLAFRGPLPTELVDEIAGIINRHLAIENLAKDPMQTGFTPECSPPPEPRHPWESDQPNEIGGDDQEPWK